MGWDHETKCFPQNPNSVIVCFNALWEQELNLSVFLSPRVILLHHKYLEQNVFRTQFCNTVRCSTSVCYNVMVLCVLCIFRLNLITSLDDMNASSKMLSCCSCFFKFQTNLLTLGCCKTRCNKTAQPQEMHCGCSVDDYGKLKENGKLTLC